MSDRLIIERISKKAPCNFRFEGSQCTELSFTDPKCAYFGTIRLFDRADKEEILNLAAKLTSLRTIDLRKNKIKAVPPFENLQELKVVDLGSNYMKAVPAWLKDSKVEWLNLGVNHLESVPEWITDLPLTTLKLHKNQLKSLPPINQCIKSLNLYLNPLSIPDFFCSLSNIEFFSGGCQITELPENIGTLQNIEWLSFVANQIRRIPDSFYDLKKLKGVRFAKNQISEISNRVGQLSALEEITFYRNRIQSLPESFYDLNLRKVSFEQNPLNADVKLRLQKQFSNLSGMGSQTFFAV